MTEEAPPLESWQRVWREGLAPLLTLEQLKALEFGLRTNDEHLIQGATTEPPPLQCCGDWPIEKSCLIGYCFVQADRGFAREFDVDPPKWNDLAPPVSEVETFFFTKCFEVDQRIGEPGGIRWLLNPFDEWPRDVMRANLLPEVQAEIARREAPCAL